jgi:acyl-CoA dehydrogenase
MTVAPGGARDRVEFAEGRLSGVLHDVPWSREAAGVVAVVEAADATHVVLLDRTGYSTRPGHDLAGQPRDRLRLDGAQVASWRAPVGLPEALRRQGALVRTAQMAGALQTVAGMTLRYTKERVQFGRPIGAFQAVQQHVVTLAQAAEITSMGLWQAARAASNRSGSFEICAAKLLADENARVATRTAHQAHGAIGMTREYPLHQYTRRLNSWRHEFGTERELAVLLGTAMGGAPSFAHALSDDDNRLEVSWAT